MDGSGMGSGLGSSPSWPVVWDSRPMGLKPSQCLSSIRSVWRKHTVQARFAQGSFIPVGFEWIPAHGDHVSRTIVDAVSAYDELDMESATSIWCTHTLGRTNTRCTTISCAIWSETPCFSVTTHEKGCNWCASTTVESDADTGGVCRSGTDSSGSGSLTDVMSARDVKRPINRSNSAIFLADQ